MSKLIYFKRYLYVIDPYEADLVVSLIYKNMLLGNSKMKISILILNMLFALLKETKKILLHFLEFLFSTIEKTKRITLTKKKSKAGL